MSYILDALRKADAERQRGAVPGLHAQPLAPAAADGGPAAAGPRGLAWLVAALAVGAAAALAWALWRQGAAPAAPPATPPATPPAAVVPTQPATAPPVAVTGAPPPPAAAAIAAAPAAARPPPLLAAGPSADRGGAPALPMAPARPAPAAAPQPPAPVLRPAVPAVAAQPAPVARPAAVAEAPAPATVAEPAAPRLPTLAELPEATRRALPPLQAGGGMYAEQAALRMVVLNGQVFHEGDRPAPELLVQQIRPRSVVLVFRGQRFELPM